MQLRAVAGGLARPHEAFSQQLLRSGLCMDAPSLLQVGPGGRWDGRDFAPLKPACPPTEDDFERPPHEPGDLSRRAEVDEEELGWPGRTLGRHWSGWVGPMSYHVTTNS